MGNSASTYNQVPQSQISADNTNIQDTTLISPSMLSELPPEMEMASDSMPMPTMATPKVVVKKQPAYVHPFIEMINRGCSEAEMINTLQAFCGRVEVGQDQLGRPIYEAVDQIEFIAPVLHVFSYCANNGKKSVVQWLVTNYIPLQVSYENNFCFFECLQWKHLDIAEMIVNHESFEPTMQVLENLLSRDKFANFRTCMNSPRLCCDFRTYRFTFMHYIDNNQFTNVRELYKKIRQRESGQNISIDDQIYPNPRLAKLQTVSQEQEAGSGDGIIREQTHETITEPEDFSKVAIDVDDVDDETTENVLLESSIQVTNTNMNTDINPTMVAEVTDMITNPDELNAGVHQRNINSDEIVD